MSSVTDRPSPPEALDLLAVPRGVWTLVPERLLRARRVLPVEVANAASPRMAIELDGGGSTEPLPDDWLVPLATDDGKW